MHFGIFLRKENSEESLHYFLSNQSDTVITMSISLIFSWDIYFQEVSSILFLVSQLDRSKGIIFVLGVGKPVFLEFE